MNITEPLRKNVDGFKDNFLLLFKTDTSEYSGNRQHN